MSAWEWGLGMRLVEIAECVHDASKICHNAVQFPYLYRMTDKWTQAARGDITTKFSILLKELLSKVSADWEDIGLILELKEGT